jgi:hypothetical protein
MYKSRSQSMQRGAHKRDRKPMSKEAFYEQTEIVLTEEETAHFHFDAIGRSLLLDRLRPVIYGYAKNGFRKPRDVARLLNKAGLTTACGAHGAPACSTPTPGGVRKPVAVIHQRQACP